MSKRLLLIDSDEHFAHELAAACTARGLEVDVAVHSEEGMTLAKERAPDLIVVCVEAQPTNGYMLCTRLKKDGDLKKIPIVLTSSQATPDSFEKHKKLKTRAEEYLIKPFSANDLLAKTSALLGISLPPAAPPDMVATEDESLGLGDLVSGEDEPIHLADATDGAEEVVEVEEVEEVVEEAPAGHGGDDDLEIFDQAFEALESKKPGPPAAASSSAPPPPAESAAETEEAPHHEAPRELTAPDDDAVLSGLLAGEEDFAAAPEHTPAEEIAHVDEATEAPHVEESYAAEETGTPAGFVDEGAHAELQARVHELEDLLAQRTSELESARKTGSSSGELLKLKEARNKQDKEVLRLKEELHAKEKELVELQEQQHTLETRNHELQDEAAKKDGSAKALQQRADALAAAAKKFERELGAAREELKQASVHKTKLTELTAAHEALQQQHTEAQGFLQAEKGRAEQLNTELSGARELHSDELEKVRAEVADARGELSRASAEAEKVREELHALTGEKDLLSEERDDLRKQLAEAQATATRNEERAVKAYQKIKSDEKLREKTRKALQIALQLLEDNAEGAEAADTGPEKQSA